MVQTLREPPNSNIQIPERFQEPITIKMPCAGWSLEFESCPDVGIWSFFLWSPSDGLNNTRHGPALFLISLPTLEHYGPARAVSKNGGRGRRLVRIRRL